LEALDGLINYDFHGQPEDSLDIAGAKAITALRQAIEDELKGDTEPEQQERNCGGRK
jgi:hypothetical protein